MNSSEVRRKGEYMQVLEGENSVRDGIIMDGGEVSIVGMANVGGKNGTNGVKTRNRDDGGVKILVGGGVEKKGVTTNVGKGGV